MDEIAISETRFTRPSSRWRAETGTDTKGAVNRHSIGSAARYSLSHGDSLRRDC